MTSPRLALALLALVALPLAAGCGGESGTAGTAAPTAAEAAATTGSGCASAFDVYAEEADKGLDNDRMIRGAVLAALTACTADEYVAESRARYEGTFGLGDVIAACDDDLLVGGERPTACSEVATSTDPRWAKACAAYAAEWGKPAAICEARKA